MSVKVAYDIIRVQAVGARLGKDYIRVAAIPDSPVDSVNSQTGNVVLDAGDIGVTDAGGNYTATDVEGVLAEIAPQLTGGDVVGPAIATDNAIARFDGTTGKLLQDSGITISDAGDITLSGNSITTSLTDRSVFIGRAGLQDDGTDNENVGIGSLALADVTSGQGNVAIGSGAAGDVSIGNDNMAFGRNAFRLGTGSNNTAVGASSLFWASSGGNNTAIGKGAGGQISDGSNLTTVNNSVFIGNDTKANANSETNQIVVGHSAVGNGTNTATWGNTSITEHYFSGNVNLLSGDLDMNGNDILDVGSMTVESNGATAFLNIKGGGVNSRADINFSSNQNTNSGVFQLDQGGNMVFRTLQSGMYFDNNATNGQIIFRNGAAQTTRMKISSQIDAFLDLDMNGNDITAIGQLSLNALNTAPASASATGTTGEIRIDANHIYVCTATNTWKRVAIATW